MKTNKTLRLPAVCVIQAGILLLSNTVTMLPVSASSHSSSKSAKQGSQSSQIDQYEEQLFGATHPDWSTDQRLDKLEKIIFGSTKSGSTDKRLKEIGKAIGPKGQNELLPAMAPQMDTAGSSASVAPDRDDTPVSSGSTTSGGMNATEKEQLKEAMDLYSQGQVDEAAGSFRKIIASDNKCVDAYFNLGVLEEGRGNLSEALRNYKSASRLNPSDGEIAQAVTAVEKKLGSIQGGGGHSQSASQQAPQTAQGSQSQQSAPSSPAQMARLKGLVSDAATAYKGGNYDRAISDLTTVAREEPGDPDVQYALAQAYKGKGRYAQAKAALSNAIASDPGNSLYTKAMSDLNAKITARGGGSGGGFGSGSGSGSGSGQLTGFTGGGSSSDAPPGQLTPFSGGSDEMASRSYNGSVFGGPTAGLMGGSMMGSSLLGGLFGGGGSNMRSQMSGLSSSRMKRAAIDGLAGAAMGAVYAKTTHTSMKQGAMKGALMGGLMGIFSGY